MVNGALQFGLAPFDFTMERGNPGFQFVDGKMIDILPGELLHRIVGALREKIVGLHAHNVDPGGAHVNKPCDDRAVARLKKAEKGDEWPNFLIG